MSKGNSKPNIDLSERVDKAVALLNEALFLLDVGRTSRVKQSKAQKAKRANPQTLSYSLNVRAFMKRYSANTSGSQKFVLLTAKLSNGKPGVDVAVKDVESAWNRMTGVVGAYNPAHPTRAKEKGWLNPTKQGVYSLSSSWKEAIEG